MSTKIFPFRRYNPDKGRAATGLPEQPPPSQEEQRIMRQLLAEQAALALAKRAAAMPSAPAKTEPEPVRVSVWGFEPEYILAYDEMIPRRVKRTGPPAKRRALDAAVAFLRAFRHGEPSLCEICKFDITSTDPDGQSVPYGVFVCEQRGVVSASGLCRDCAADHVVKVTGDAEDGRPVVVTTMEWMTTKGVLSGKSLPPEPQPKGKRP
jgi:hypothetical protein